MFADAKAASCGSVVFESHIHLREVNGIRGPRWLDDQTIGRCFLSPAAAAIMATVVATVMEGVHQAQSLTSHPDHNLEIYGQHVSNVGVARSGFVEHAPALRAL